MMNGVLTNGKVTLATTGEKVTPEQVRRRVTDMENEAIMLIADMVQDLVDDVCYDTSEQDGVMARIAVARAFVKYGAYGLAKLTSGESDVSYRFANDVRDHAGHMAELLH